MNTKVKIEYRWWVRNDAYPEWTGTVWSENSMDKAIETLKSEFMRGIVKNCEYKLLKETTTEEFEEIELPRDLVITT